MKYDGQGSIAIGMALCFALGGCASEATSEHTGTNAASAEVADDAYTRFLSLRIDDGGQSSGLQTFESSYFNSKIRDICGGDYTVDLQLEFGRVTNDTVEVIGLNAWYHMNADVTVVPTAHHLYNQESGDKTLTELPFGAGIVPYHDGDSHHYDVNKTYRVSSGDAVVLEFHSGPGQPNGDTTDYPCFQNFAIVMAPAGKL